MILIILEHKSLMAITVETVDVEKRAFSSIKKAEQWLLENNFYKGRRDFFKYDGNGIEWCHKDDKSWDYLDVTIEELKMDDRCKSKYQAVTAKQIL